MSARQQREPVAETTTAGNRTPSPRRSAWSSTTASSIASRTCVPASTPVRTHREQQPRATRQSNSPGPPGSALLGRPHPAARRSGTESTPSKAPLLNSSPVRRVFQDGNARTTDSALHAHRRPLFRNPPSTATSKAGSTRRVQCPRTPAHRAVLAPSTTYRPNAPESATASERYAAARHPTETANLRTGAECGAPGTCQYPPSATAPGTCQVRTE